MSISAVEAPEERAGDPSPSRAPAIFGALLVCTQRIAVPSAGGAPVSALVALLLCLYLISSRRAVVGVGAFATYVALVMVSAFSFVVAPSPLPVSGTVSILSLGFLLVAYLPSLVRPARTATFGRFFFAGTAWAIVGGAAMAILQQALQMVGRGYVDFVGGLPSPWLIEGFNSYYMLTRPGGSYTKPNGMIFLEPSFLSLYSAIALVWFLVVRADFRDRRGLWYGSIFVLGLGIAVSSSSSGVVVLGAAAAAFMLNLVRWWRPLALGVVGAIGLFVAGALDPLIAKLGEGFVGDTSTALRLVEPYRFFEPFILERPFLGWGPGAGSLFAGSYGGRGLQVPTLVKATLEYGMVGAALVCAIVAGSLWRGGAPLPLILASLVAWLVPGEALLNINLTTILLVGLVAWGASSSDSDAVDDVEQGGLRRSSSVS